MQDLTFLTEVPKREQKEFGVFIRSTRKEFIASPKDTVKSVLEKYPDLTKIQKDQNISAVIRRLREKAFDSFCLSEAKMNAHILKNISEKFTTPKSKFDHLYDIFDKSSEEIKDRLRNFFGDFAGQIYPYIYGLSLSNTQSRRSRAGKEFEEIVYALYDALKYPYESQASVGSKNFESKNLGKKVDSILPSLKAFGERRDKVIIGTMKTTLRERWQEVIEEINRTGLPSIYLLTVDENISSSKVEQMANHNVILVVYKNVKQTTALVKRRNVVSFEDFFFKEIPEHLRYWDAL